MQLGLIGMVFLVFLILKLLGVIAWSWLWVTSPLWLSLALYVFIWFVVLRVLKWARGGD